VCSSDLEFSKEIVEATNETEAALKVLGQHLDDIMFFMTPEEKKGRRMTMDIGPEKITEELQFLHNNYKIIYGPNRNSVLLVHTKHKMGELRYNLREPMEVTPPHDTFNISRFEARRIGKNIYEVIQTYTLKENQSTTMMSYGPELR
jgi:hypothetical protein